MNYKAQVGSSTAKGGFENEKAVVAKFNDFKNDRDAQFWLVAMGYDITKINQLFARQIPPRISKVYAQQLEPDINKIDQLIRHKKADIVIELIIKIDRNTYQERLSLKMVSNKNGYNQIDKRKVEQYKIMWEFDDEIALWLKLFTGEFLPTNYSHLFANGFKLRRPDRIFLDEAPIQLQANIINFFTNNRIQIANDLLRGRGALSADWLLITLKNDDDTITYGIYEINFATNFFGNGIIQISNKGSLHIGNITMQRKGGTPDPTSLQFKINPCDILQ